MRKIAWVLTAVLLATALPLAAQEESDRGRMFIRLTASDLTIQNSGLFLAVKEQPAGSTEPDKVVDAKWNSRLTPELLVGFELKRNRGTVQFRYFQFDHTLDIGDDGASFRNVWASGIAGWDEDADGDGDVDGWDCGSGPVFPNPPGGPACEEDGDNDVGDSIVPNIKDGAEDDNMNRVADHIGFTHSNNLLAQSTAELQTWDIEYVRRFAEGNRFSLDWSAGIRYARVKQDLGISYREFGAFAAYRDNPNDSSRTTAGGLIRYIDADGDGNLPDTSGLPAGDRSGDGWGNGNGPRVNGGFGPGTDSRADDDLISVPTINEDRITASVDADGFGMVFGLRGETWLTRDPMKKKVKRGKKGFPRRWSLESGLRVGFLSGDQDYRYDETFTRERDALPNFIDWDFNQDGVYGVGAHGHDFDFNGDGVVDQRDWDPNTVIPEEREAWDNRQINIAAQRDGILESVRGNCEGCREPDPGDVHPYQNGFIDEGDPIPESERNTSIYRMTTSRSDGGSRSRMFTSLELDVGLRYRFSRFADIAFGARTSRWFDVGNLKNVPLGADARMLTDGDMTMDGFFVTLTVWPRI
jgi:hypothetical protein